MTTDNDHLDARVAVSALLEGQPSGEVAPTQLGKFAELYGEMQRAHADGGREAARQVFVAYADRDPAVAALRAADPEPPKRLWTAAELLAHTFSEPKWAVPGLLPVGLTNAAGRPKIGKSWMSLGVGVAVATGGRFLGREVSIGKVLYLALEDNPRRIQDRLRKQKAPPTSNLHFRYEWQPLTKGGAADLIVEINQHEYTLIVIDTLSRAVGNADQMDQAEMTVCLGALQRIALDRDIAILLVDHHRKTGAMGAGDVIDDVMGATSKAGVIDAAWGLYRRRGEKDATLKVVGRDIDDQELAVRFDPELFCWQFVGDASSVKAETVQADIALALNELGGTATVTKIANYLNKPKPNVAREMQELVRKMVVTREVKKGREVPYTLLRRDLVDNHSNVGNSSNDDSDDNNDNNDN